MERYSCLRAYNVLLYFFEVQFCDQKRVRELVCAFILHPGHGRLNLGELLHRKPGGHSKDLPLFMPVTGSQNHGMLAIWNLGTAQENKTFNADEHSFTLATL